MTKYLIFLLCQFGHLCQAEELNIASIDWCPQLCTEGKKAGYITDTIELIFRDSPYTLDIETYPWSRAILLVKVGKKHALLSPAKNEAPSLIYPRNEVGIQRMCFFTRQDSNWSYEGLSSLKGLRIGIAVDTSVAEFAQYERDNKRQFQYIPYNKTYIEQSLKKLKSNRIDTFLFTYNSTIFKMKKIGVLADYKEAGCVSSTKVYLAFSPHPNLNTERMITYFDEQMDKIKASGAISDIMHRYGLENWQ